MIAALCRPLPPTPRPLSFRPAPFLLYLAMPYSSACDWPARSCSGMTRMCIARLPCWSPDEEVKR